jgi:hypothetical protein
MGRAERAIVARAAAQERISMSAFVRREEALYLLTIFTGKHSAPSYFRERSAHRAAPEHK